MIRSTCAFALACLLTNFAVAQPMLVPPTPSNTTVPSPSFSTQAAPSNDSYQDVAPPAPSDSHSYESAPSYDSTPIPSSNYESTPSYESHPAPSYEYTQPAPTYSAPPVSYDSYQAPSQGCASCNGTSAMTGMASYGAYAPTSNFIGASSSSFGGIPSTTTAADNAHPYIGGAAGTGLHIRNPYYGYRHPWTTRGPESQNVTIAW